MDKKYEIHTEIKKKLPFHPLEAKVRNAHLNILESVESVAHIKKVFAKMAVLTIVAAACLCVGIKLATDGTAAVLRWIGYALSMASVVIEYAAYDVHKTFMRDIASMVFFKYEYDGIVMDSVKYHYENICGDSATEKELVHLQTEFCNSSVSKDICEKILKPR